MDLKSYAKKEKIKYFMVTYTDLFGVQRAKLVPASAISDMQKDGAGFAGFASWLDMTPAHPDMLAVPDPESVIKLPWKKDVAWLASNCMMEDKLVEQAPRNVLNKAIARAKKGNMRVKTGVEAEFFLLSPEGSAISDPFDNAEKPCYDQQALMRRYDVIAEICDYLGELGWGPYQNDHEDANGQFEMNFEFDDALRTADKHSFFKFMVKSVAEKHGLRATFMPKPIEGLTGNGCHAHISVWDGKKNKFLDKSDKLGLSKMAYNFLGGVIKNASSLSAFFNPTINSYRRINAPPTKSGASWSPSSISYTGNNRTHMIRIPDPGRFELRLMDGSANPYLLQASVLAAGLYGLKNKIDPGEPLTCNMYTDYKKYPNLPKLPNELQDSLELLKNNKEMNEAFGKETINSYIKLRKFEINEFDNKENFDKSKPVTQWERQNTLDC